MKTETFYCASPIDGRYMTFQCLSNENMNIGEINIYTKGNPYRKESKSGWVTSSSGYSNRDHADVNLIDNNVWTKYASKTPDKWHWFQVDFGKEIKVNRFKKIGENKQQALHLFQQIARVDITKRTEDRRYLNQYALVQVRIGNHNVGNHALREILSNTACDGLEPKKPNLIPVTRHFCKTPLNGRYLTAQSHQSKHIEASNIEIYTQGKAKAIFFVVPFS